MSTKRKSHRVHDDYWIQEGIESSVISDKVDGKVSLSVFYDGRYGNHVDEIDLSPEVARNVAQSLLRACDLIEAAFAEEVSA